MIRTAPLKIVLLYFVLGLCWILLGGRLVDMVSGWLPFSRENLELVKGIFFIAFTALLLYQAIKSQQLSLMKSERQYKGLFYSNPTPLWIYDRQTLKFLDVNVATIKQYGYSSAAFKKMSILEIRDIEDSEIDGVGAKFLTEEMKYSGKCQHVNNKGEKITVLINSHKIYFEGRDCVMVMAKDITLQLEQDEKLQESMIQNKRLTEVIDRIFNMVVITDTLGRVSWVNQAFVDFTGYELHEIEGKSTEFLHGPLTDPHLPGKIIEALRANEFGVFEILNYTKSGNHYWIDMTISGVYNDQNEVYRYISIQNIITERKQSEEKLQQQNKILRKMSWTNSHAIRKPVASIISLVELSKEMSDGEELKAIQGLIGICSLELDEITKEVSKMMSDINVKE